MRSIGTMRLALLLFAVAAPATAQDGPAAAPSPKPESSPKPSVVLLTIDTLRADHLSCYGYFRKTSPFVDSLASESLVFERCYATISHTTPSHASLLTSVLPLEHGITANSFRATSEVQRARALVTTEQLKSYAQILQSRGWSTGAFVAAATTRKVTGLSAGFDAWTEPADVSRIGSEVLADATKWLETLPPPGERPFFLWVHFFDVHGPHMQGGRYESEFPDDDALAEHLRERRVRKAIPGRKGSRARPSFLNSLYDAAIRRTDDLVSELVATLKKTGRWEGTAFVLTSDHGEGLGEHGLIGHELAWGEQVRVPLLIRITGREPARIDTPVSGIDVLPTLLDLVPGLPREELLAQATGTSVVAERYEERPVFSMAAAEKQYALTTSRWKLLRTVGEGDALFDLQADPHELRDVGRAHPEIVAALATQLDLSLAEQEKRRTYLRRGGVEPTLTDEEERKLLESLKALGYVGEGEDEDESEEGGDRSRH